MNASGSNNSVQVLLFLIENIACALRLQEVVKVIHAIEVTRLPDAPEIVIGIINLHGAVIPVVDFRNRFGLKTRRMELSDRLIIAQTTKRMVAVLADSVLGVKTLTPAQLEPTKEKMPFIEHISGIAKIDNSMILIYNLEKSMSLDEEEELEFALKSTHNEK
jgi:purine-binding chemotaxis protein CheW